MQTVTLEEAQARLPELVAGLANERAIVITHNGAAVARLEPETAPAAPAKKRGHSMLDSPPISLGAPLRPYPHPDDDILDEMIGDKFDHLWPKIFPDKPE